MDVMYNLVIPNVIKFDRNHSADENLDIKVNEGPSSKRPNGEVRK